MVSLNRLLFLVEILGSVSGLDGSGRIQVLGRMFGFGLTLFLLSLPRCQGSSDWVVSYFWLSLILLMLSFAKLGCPFPVGLVILLSLLINFLDFVGHILPQEPCLDLPRITGRDLQEVARAKKNLLLVVWMGGHGMKLRLFRYPGFLVLLFFWSWLKLLECGLRVC